MCLQDEQKKQLASESVAWVLRNKQLAQMFPQLQPVAEQGPSADAPATPPEDGDPDASCACQGLFLRSHSLTILPCLQGHIIGDAHNSKVLYTGLLASVDISLLLYTLHPGKYCPAQQFTALTLPVACPTPLLASLWSCFCDLSPFKNTHVCTDAGVALENLSLDDGRDVQPKQPSKAKQPKAKQRGRRN